MRLSSMTFWILFFSSAIYSFRSRPSSSPRHKNDTTLLDSRATRCGEVLRRIILLIKLFGDWISRSHFERTI